MSENTITIINDEGIEKQMQILFTFETDENQYVLFFDPEDEEIIHVGRYNEIGEIFTDLSEEELSMVQEIFDVYTEENGFEKA